MTAARPWIKFTSTVLGGPDAAELARFYGELLEWDIDREEPDWVVLRSPDRSQQLSFQSEPDHVRPVWPSAPDQQQMMLHLDIEVHDLEGAGAYASQLGATLADFQPQDDVRVYLDPAGHPFCLWIAT